MIQTKVIEEQLPVFLKESSNLMVMVLDLEGNGLYTNPYLREFFEFTNLEDEVISFHDLINDIESTEFEIIIDKSIQSPNQVFKFHHKHLMQLVCWEFSVFNNNDGDIFGILGIGTQQEEIEVMVGPENKKINLQTDVCFQLNANWEIQYANPMAASLFGTELTELIKQKVWHVFKHPKIYEYALEFKKAKESGSARTFEDYITELGKWYQVIINPQDDMLDVYFKDISEVKSLARQNNLMQLTLEAVMENASEIFFLMTNEMRIIKFNALAKDLVHEVFNKVLQENERFVHYLLPGIEEIFLKNIDNIFGGKTVEFDQIVQFPDPSENRLYHHQFIPICDANHKVVCMVYRAKDLQHELNHVGKVLKNNELLREIIHTQSNVLRSPLSSILGLLDLIDKKQLNKENQQYFSYLKPLAEELDQIIRNNTKKMNQSDTFGD
ncbi:PAS domain-containing protein [Aquiflexum sp.]|uniref:PAS domain-containing protein n=1 Tax=Aquiflexum sp. TaxID=1872584 RepID=UPI0035948449